MLDIQFIRSNLDAIRKAIRDKGVECDIDRLVSLDAQRRKMIEEVDAYRAERNTISRSIAEGKGDKAQLIRKMQGRKEGGKELERELKDLEMEYERLLLLVPNIPWKGSPVGADAESNKEIKRVGKPPVFSFKPKDHLALGQSLNLLDVDRGTKTSGFRGYYLKNEAVLMQWGLLTLGIERMRKAGFELMITPSIVKGFALVGSGHFPFGEEEIYRIANPGRMESDKEHKEPTYLAGTAEPSLLAYYADTVLPEKELPKTLCGISPCYRSEAGSYGKDTKGLFRLHEFWKVEQLVICDNDPKETEKWFDMMLGIAESMVSDLGLPYRLVEASTGDMGAGKVRMVDLETWMPSSNGYRETHSCSNLTDWQARRLNIKVKKGSETAYAYTLNNTVIASPRILIAILENYQQKDGSVKVPKVLQKIVGKKIIKPGLSGV